MRKGILATLIVILMIIPAVGCIGTELGVDVDVPTEVTMLEPMTIKVTLKNEPIVLAQDARDIEISVESDALEKISPQNLQLLQANDKKTLYFYTNTKTVKAGWYTGEVVIKYLEGTVQKTESKQFKFEIRYPGIQISIPSKISERDGEKVSIPITLKNGDVIDYEPVEIHLSTPTSRHVTFESEVIELGKIIHGEERSFDIYVIGHKAGVVKATTIINVNIVYNGVSINSAETHFEIS